MRWSLPIVSFIVACNAPRLFAADPAGLEFFEKNIRPLLAEKCYKCHSIEKGKSKGALTLDTRAGWQKGGEGGPSIVPGKPESSLLYKAVTWTDDDTKMPPKEEGGKLPDAKVALIKKWIEMGAPDPRETAAIKAPGITPEARAHWAFQPVKGAGALLPPKNVTAAGVPPLLDDFILTKLKPLGLALSAPASKEALQRRATFDLTGLPPTIEEIDAFLGDTSPNAYEKVLDRLLASPHYGERWGRHWLDLARFAESDGYEYDATRPNAWRYRDYVIRSFNTDKPYDRFIREQVAGDELFPGDSDALVATGFNLLGPDMVDSSDQIQRRHNTLNDMTDTTALAFLGLTIGCARCHDHKFEPLLQRDYYSLQAFFTPAKFHPDYPVAGAAERSAHDAAVKQYNENPQVKELIEFEAPTRTRLYEKKLAKLSPEAQAAFRTPPEQRNAEQSNLVLETQGMVELSDKEVASAINGDGRVKHQALLDAVRKIPKPSALPKAMTLGSEKARVKTFVLHRGEYNQPGDEVEPGFPSVLPNGGKADSSKRAVLANWIASAANPLTARVMINRVWQHHFGRGLVESTSDFGALGQKPSHPELLDWLAAEFAARGWSLKQMHKLIMLSATYRQASSPAPVAADPENRLYSHMNPMRLEGEIIRDALLSISAQLNLKMGGPGIFPPIPKGIKGWTPTADASEHIRRSIYIFARRNLRFPFLEVFDAPDSNLSCPARERSTTAPQALTLLNADEVVAASKAFAERLTKMAKEKDEQIVLGYRLALGRKPSEKELGFAREFLKTSPLKEFCRALFNLNDFVYVE